MTLARLLNQPVTIQSRTATAHDGYGNELEGTLSTVDTVGYLEQTDSTEITVDRETYISNWVAYLPAGTVVVGSDRIIYAGQTFEVIGPPDRVWNPRLRRESHVVARLRNTSG